MTPTLAPHVIPFCDDFETGSLYNWLINVGASGDLPVVRADDTLSGTLVPHSGSWVAFLGDETNGGTATATMDLELNLAGETSVLLDFYWVTYSLEFDQFIFLDIYDGSWHNDVLRYQGETWRYESVDLSSDYTMIDGFIVRFRSYVDYTEDFDATYVDDVCVIDPSVPTPTHTASPVPSESPCVNLVLSIVFASMMILPIYRAKKSP
jgi:hypothetical protein